MKLLMRVTLGVTVGGALYLTFAILDAVRIANEMGL